MISPFLSDFPGIEETDAQGKGRADPAPEHPSRLTEVRTDFPHGARPAHNRTDTMSRNRKRSRT